MQIKTGQLNLTMIDPCQLNITQTDGHTWMLSSAELLSFCLLFVVIVTIVYTRTGGRLTPGRTTESGFRPSCGLIHQVSLAG